MSSAPPDATADATIRSSGPALLCDTNADTDPEASSEPQDGYYIPNQASVDRAVLRAARTRVRPTVLRTELGLDEPEFAMQYHRISTFIESYVKTRAAGRQPHQLEPDFWPSLIRAVRNAFPHLYQGPYLLARVRVSIHHARRFCFPEIKLNLNRKKSTSNALSRRCSGPPA
ncbi:hypothetical protein R3P38DRAFT_3168861 [Favolaschia claudopus]|uniref:Uncharacterized protein n=1 Tax=Favolaschia claudopus TaxID=2862362 RepID=A0AAW0DZB3_9AGAR